MKLKPLTLAIVLGLVILVPSILVGVTISEFPSDPEGYSPWGDLNDDGIIDIFDIVWIANRYDDTGLPVNKTALLYEANATYAELLQTIDSLESEVALLRSHLDGNVSEFIIRISNLEINLELLNASKLGTPLFDSGWMSLATGQNTFYFSEALGTDNVFVYMVGKKLNTTIQQHQIDYGGYQNVASYNGAYWYNLTQSYIQVNRHGNDYNWNYVRIYIWEIPIP